MSVLPKPIWCRYMIYIYNLTNILFYFSDLFPSLLREWIAKNMTVRPSMAFTFLVRRSKHL